MILKILKSTKSITQPKEGVVGVNNDSKARCNRSKFHKNEIDDNEVDSGKVDNETKKKSQKMSKFKNLFKSKKLYKSKKTLELDFSFIFGARLVFTKLKQAFVKALILHYFDLKRYIWVETNVSSYAIGRIFNQLTSNDSDR